MEIKNCRAAFRPVQPLQKPPGDWIRPEPEITPATRGNVPPKKTYSGDRQFKQTARASRVIGKTRRIRHPVMVMLDRINTRTVTITRFAKHIQGPLIAVPNGKAGCAITGHDLTGDVFQNGFALDSIFAELAGFLVRNAMVTPTMTGELVAIGNDPLHHCRVALSNPSQRKKSCFYIFLTQQGEDSVNIGLYPTGYGCPALARNVRGKCRNLEVIFHIYGHCIAQRYLIHH